MSIGNSQQGVNVGGGNPGTDRKLEENIEFGWGILIGTEEKFTAAK